MSITENTIISENILNPSDLTNEKIVSLNFIKWAGGKKQLLPIISKHLPETIENYFEPFIGGGAVFFYILQKYKPKKAYISDVNSRLITTYKVVKDNVEDLIIELDKHKQNNLKDFEIFGTGLADRLNKLNKLKKTETGLELEKVLNEIIEVKAKKKIEKDLRYYYIERNKFNSKNLKLSDVQIAAYFIYFNKAGFNGMYREDLKGNYNIPMGSSTDVSFDYERLRKTSDFLNNCDIEIKVACFKEIKNLVCENSFVYMDPPYDPLKKSASFTTYTKAGFSDDDQKDVADLFKNLHNKNCKVMLSNSNTEFMNELYSEFKPMKVNANRSINSIGSNRGPIKEILVKNY